MPFPQKQAQSPREEPLFFVKLMIFTKVLVGWLADEGEFPNPTG